MNALARHNAARQRPPAWERRVPRFLPQQTASVSAADALEGGHPLADAIVNAGLQRRANEIAAAFDTIEPELRAIASAQFEDGFVEPAAARLKASLGIDVPPETLRATWSAPLDARKLYAECVLGTFCRLVDRSFDRDLATLSEGESAQDLIRRWGFHAVDITPCADGRLSGVVDYILRVPPAVVVSRLSHAGAMFDVEDALRTWETVELRRYRESRPNPASEPTRFLKIGVYHYSSVDPDREGCAAHGSDAGRAASSLLERLDDFARAVELTHCCGATVATLLCGVDTDTDALRVHVPDASGRASVSRWVDNRALYASTKMLSRDGAKNAIRDAVAACAGVAAGDRLTEGMRWFCGYLLKNNLSQMEAVRARHGGSYADRGHTERLAIVGDALDDVQLRNLAFQAQMETVEEGAADLDVGVRVLRGVHEPRGLAVPILAHFRYDARVPSARARARERALRLRDAIIARYARLAESGLLHVRAVVRGGDGAPLETVHAHAAENRA